MGVRGTLPVFARAAILRIPGFGLNSTFGEPSELYKVRFNTDDSIIIDGSSRDDLLIRYHGKTKHLDESSVTLACLSTLVGAKGNPTLNFPCAGFPIAVDPNIKFDGTVNLGDQSQLSTIMGRFSAISIDIRLTMFSDGLEKDSDTVTITL